MGEPIMDSFDDFDDFWGDSDKWDGEDEKYFQEELEILQIIPGKKIKDSFVMLTIGHKKIVEEIIKKSKVQNLILLHFLGVPDNRTFLEDKENAFIPYGFWTCKCETGYLKSGYVSSCSKCGCDINESTNKIKYLEDILKEMK